MKYRTEIDGLRAVAVLPVIFYHAGFDFFSGGYVGVDIFFVISGYLITTIILTESDSGKFTIADFYERRARRILPALFFVMFSCLPFAWNMMLSDELKEFFQSVMAVSLFSSNILFWLKTGYFATSAEYIPLLHTWSLAVEEQYYVLFPLFILFTLHFGKRSMISLLLLIGISSLYLAHWGSIYAPTASFYLLPTRLWELLTGSLCAVYLLYGKSTRLNNMTLPFPVMQTLSACGLLLILYAIFVFDGRTPGPGLYTLVPTSGTALLILFCTPRTFTGSLLSNRLLVGIGLVSYSAYLWHYPLFAFARISSFSVPGNDLMTGLVFLSLVLSYITWKYIEKPFRDKKMISRKLVLQAAMTSFVCFGSIGLAAHFHDGEIGNFASYNMRMKSEIGQLWSERRLLIRDNVCNIGFGDEEDLDYFLENWNCRDTGGSGSIKNIPVVVAGDSLAADIAAAFRLNGYHPVQMTGAGCSTNPDFMTNECSQIFSRLFDEVHNNPYYKFIILANRYRKAELSIQSIRETIDYWEKFGIKIILFSGMPDFHNLERAVRLSADIIPDMAIAKYSEREELLSYLKERGVHVINRREIFCAITASCNYRDADQELLVLDDNHLSPLGAKLFGQKLFQKDVVIGKIIKNLTY